MKNKVIFDGEVILDLTPSTVEPSKVLSGYKGYDRNGAFITGNCTFDADTKDANVLPSEVLNGRTYYKNGAKGTGQMVNNGAVSGTISTKAEQYTIPIGYHDGSGKVSIASTEQTKIVAGNIKQGVTILGVEGSYSGAGATSEAKEVTPSSSEQIVLPTGADYLSQVTVKAIPYQEIANAYGTTVIIG